MVVRADYEGSGTSSAASPWRRPEARADSRRRPPGRSGLSRSRRGPAWRPPESDSNRGPQSWRVHVAEILDFHFPEPARDSILHRASNAPCSTSHLHFDAHAAMRPTTCNATFRALLLRGKPKGGKPVRVPLGGSRRRRLSCRRFRLLDEQPGSQTYAQEWVRRAGMSKSTGLGARGLASSSANPVSELALSSADGRLDIGFHAKTGRVVIIPARHPRQAQLSNPKEGHKRRANQPRQLGERGPRLPQQAALELSFHESTSATER